MGAVLLMHKAHGWILEVRSSLSGLIQKKGYVLKLQIADFFYTVGYDRHLSEQPVHHSFMHIELCSCRLVTESMLTPSH